MSSLAGRAVLLGDGTLAPATLRFEGARISSVEIGSSNAPDQILAPGFVDLQVNGVDDLDVASAEGRDWDELDRSLLAHGVTAWCPTLVTAPLTSYTERLERIAAAAARPADRRPLVAGAHLEGPFLGGAPGAHLPEYIQAVDVAFLKALPPIVRIVTLAPECPGALAAIETLLGLGVLVSLGHSTASYEASIAAVDAGAGMVTHLFNAMGPWHHRQAGLAGAALADDRLAVSLIADGVHVQAALLKMAFRAKGRGKVVLVTDAVAWKRGEAGPLRMRLADGAPRLADGTLAGSALTMDAAVRTAVEAGVPLAPALEAASSTPAALIGLRDRGRLLVGRRADVVVLSRDLDVREVWVGGRRAWPDPR